MELDVLNGLCKSCGHGLCVVVVGNRLYIGPLIDSVLSEIKL